MKILWFLLLGATTAHADIYKSIDSNGNVVFSDHPSKGAEKLTVPPVPPAPASPPENETAPATPSMGEKPAADAVEEERKNLQHQLDEEIASLGQAKAELKAAQDVILG
ncbi:MAG TPA: DUF4124 domain-containing protein, partial [Burkholderiales bacterium]|nr:DUF4124 domain-containing protein [Burkholderiales bacterium]